MDLLAYRTIKDALKRAYQKKQYALTVEMQSNKSSLKTDLLKLRIQAGTDFANMPRANHDAHTRRGAHNVCRYIKKRLAEMNWDAQEFAFDADNLSMGFDIDKENNQVTWHFTVPTVKH